ncbi:MAG: sulfatase [Acidobacteria bacterium]|nr:sulfatase [Acidobacteriota bacterium]MBI3655628.1 sulfatase [Acidobacteriota bacterium]
MNNKVQFLKRSCKGGNILSGILFVIGAVATVSILVFLWISRSRTENVVYSFIKNSHLAEDLNEPVTEVNIDFGNPSAAPFLAGGFSDRIETSEDGNTRWAVGRDSELLFNINQVSDKTAYLRCIPFYYEDMLPQILTIALNAQFITDIELDTDWLEYTIPLQASWLKPGENVMSFSYALATVPAEISGAEDTRALSVNFAYLRIKDAAVRKSVVVQRWTIADQTENVLAINQNEALNYYIEIPPRAHMRFDFGVLPEALARLHDVTYRVAVQLDDDSPPKEIVSMALQDETLTSTWQPHDADLTDFAGRLVRISFDVSTKSGRGLESTPWAGWGEPRLVVDKKSDSERPNRKETVSQQTLAQNFNIIVLFLDGLRADHTSHLGYFRPTTGNIDAFARESVYFGQAVSAANRELPAHVSFFTGLFPYSHGIRTAADLKNQANLSNWISVLRAKNESLTAAAFVDEIELESYYKAIGFKTYRTQIVGTATNPEATAAMPSEPASSEATDSATIQTQVNPPLNRFLESLKAASGWLTAHANERFFMVYQTGFLRPPFTPPPPYGQMFDPEYYEDSDRLLGYQIDEKTLQKVYNGELKLLEPDIKHMQALYDGKLRFLDVRIGELLKQINRLKLAENTIVVLTSGHGLQLGEHALAGTLGRTLYDEEIHVPMIMYFPKPFNLRSRAVNYQVRLVDVFPTVMARLGMPLDYPISGLDLLPLLQGESMDLPAISESISPALITYRTNDWKLIGQVSGRWAVRPALYNLRLDAAERNDYIRKRPVFAGYLAQNIASRLSFPDKYF